MSLKNFFPHEISLQDTYIFSEVTALNLQMVNPQVIRYLVIEEHGCIMFFSLISISTV